MSARYEVCVISGDSYPRRGSSQTVWVADAFYGYREAWSRTNFAPFRWKKDRATAARLCDEMNAAHDAWMRDNGYAAPVHSSVEGGDK